ncbi:MAG: DUF4364 family protein [Clostridia bacterium]|nr:DUF4364 family protein [Clostridia bacterium]
MDFDALTANVAPGGLNNRTEIRVLLCCLLANAKHPVSARLLKEGLHFEGLVNYFEVAYAMEDLLKNGNIQLVEAEQELYAITDSGKMVADTLCGDLPITVLQKGTQLVARILTRMRNEKENKVEFESVGNGCMVHCSIMEGERTVMKVSLLVPDRICGNRIKESFLEDPESVYVDIMEKLTKTRIKSDPQ